MLTGFKVWFSRKLSSSRRDCSFVRRSFFLGGPPPVVLSSSSSMQSSSPPDGIWFMSKSLMVGTPPPPPPWSPSFIVFNNSCFDQAIQSKNFYCTWKIHFFYNNKDKEQSLDHIWSKNEKSKQRKIYAYHEKSPYIDMLFVFVGSHKIPCKKKP